MSVFQYTLHVRVIPYSTYTPDSVYPTIDTKEAFANQTYRGKVVLITGSSRGIGQEAAITYAKAGANVTIAGRSQETLVKTAAAIRETVPGAHVLAIHTDVRDPKATEAAVQTTLERFSQLDILIANAGALSDVTQSKWNGRESRSSYHVQCRIGRKGPRSVVEHV